MSEKSQANILEKNIENRKQISINQIDSFKLDMSFSDDSSKNKSN